MFTIETIVRQINKDLVPQFEERLRTLLAYQNKEWLIEQVVRLTLDKHSLEEMDRKHFREEENRKRAERAKRVQKLGLNRAKLLRFVGKYKGHDRNWLIRNDYLFANAPAKGGAMITRRDRTPKGEALLAQAKDILFGLLFGDESTSTQFDRIQRKLLALTVPRAKAGSLDFLRAATEPNALGMGQDPKGAMNDSRADNIIFEIEFGDIEGELIGDGIITALSLINNLEINEEVLYGRMENIEQGTLII